MLKRVENRFNGMNIINGFQFDENSLHFFFFFVVFSQGNIKHLSNGNWHEPVTVSIIKLGHLPTEHNQVHTQKIERKKFYSVCPTVENENVMKRYETKGNDFHVKRNNKEKLPTLELLLLYGNL